MNQQFKSTDYGIPQDKLDHIKGIAEANGLVLTIKSSNHNRWLDMASCQQEENLIVKNLNRDKKTKLIKPRKMSADMFVHETLVLTSNRNTREIQLSVKKEFYETDGTLVANPIVDRIKSVPEDIRPLLRFTTWVGHLWSFWEYFVSDNVYMWAEAEGSAHLLKDDDSYVYQTFEYMKDITQSIIDVLGFEITERLMTDLVTASNKDRDAKDG